MSLLCKKISPINLLQEKANNHFASLLFLKGVLKDGCLSELHFNDLNLNFMEEVFYCSPNLTHGKKIFMFILEMQNFNNIAVTQSTTRKHLGMILNVKLDFQGHLKNVYGKVNKTIGLLQKLNNTLPRLPLLTIYKSFIRPHLDYGDIIYDHAYTASFHQKTESVQYNSELAITGAIRGTSKEKL